MRRLIVAAIVAGAARVTQLAFLSVLPRILNRADLAIWAWIDSVFSLVALASDFGIKVLATRYVARSSVVQEQVDVRSFFFVHAFNATAVILSLVILFAYLRSADLRSFAFALTVAAGAVGTNVALVEWWFNGRNRIDRSAIGRLSVEVAALATVLLSMLTTFSFAGVAASYAAALVTAVLVNTRPFWLKTRELTRHPQPWRSTYVDVMKASMPLGMNGFVSHLWFRLPTYYLGVYEPQIQAHLWLATRLLLIATEALSLVLIFKFPTWTRTAIEKPVAFRGSILRWTAYIFLFSSVLGAIVWIAAPFISSFLFNANDELQVTFIRVLIIAGLAWSTAVPGVTALLAMGRDTSVLVLTIVGISSCGAVLFAGDSTSFPALAPSAFAVSAILYGATAIILFFYMTRARTQE